MAVVVVSVVILVVPVAFVHLPALLVVVVMRVAPIGAGVRWPHPDSGHPDIAASAVAPVSLSPNETLARHGGPHLIAQRRRRTADVDVDLSDGGSGEGKKSDAPGEQVQFPD